MRISDWSSDVCSSDLLSYGELAGERMKHGLMLHDPEESHDCFSDNTHNSHFYDAMGIQNVYLGRYVRTDGSMVSGPSLSGLVVAVDPALDQEVRGRLEATAAALKSEESRVGKEGVRTCRLRWWPDH